MTPAAIFATNVRFSRSLYTGKERDTESGLDYFGARYLSSNLGRFMTPDWDAGPTDVPYADFGDPQSLNLYAYVGNNPNTAIDFDGHDADCGTNCHDASYNGPSPGSAGYVNVSTNGSNTEMSGDQYQAAQMGNNGGLDVPSLDEVGMSGDGSGNFFPVAITNASGNIVGTATYVSGGPTDYYANRKGINHLANTYQVVKAGTAIYAGVYGSVGLAIAGGEIAAGTAAARSQIIFRMAHGMRVALGHSQVLAEQSAVKNAIATAIASGAIQKVGNGFQGVVNVAGTFIRFTGGWNPAGQIVVSNVMGNALQK